MREYKRRVLLGVAAVLSLLTGVGALTSISGSTVALSTSAPDLIIETITWSPEMPSIGDTVTFTVTIKNQGSVPAGYSRVAYYIDDTYQASTFANQLDAGAAATRTFAWTARAGSQAIKAVADFENSVDESDEANNEKIFAFSVLAPDLIIEAITWSPENPSIGDRVDFTVAVKNQGTMKALTSHVDLYIDGFSRDYKHILKIEAGAVVPVTFTWKALAGSHTLKAVADVLGQVTESDETNNEKTVTYATAAPDLVVSGITWSPENPSEGTDITFTVTIKNQGNGKAGYSDVVCYIDNTYQTSIFVPLMDIGATATETFIWIARAGSHDIKAVVDYNSRITESDEANNAKTVVLPAVAPDLIIQDVTWSPTTLLPAHMVTFNITVKNQGRSEAGFFRVHLYIDGIYRAWQDVAGISAGASVNSAFNWTAQAGSHDIKVIADGDNFVDESDESNNAQTITVSTSTLTLCDLTVQSIAWSPEYPSVGDTVTFTVTIKNQGSVSAGSSRLAYYIDDTCQVSADINQISAGATATETFTWAAQAGSHTFKVVVDSNSDITEIDENNNEKSVALSVSAPDFVISDITWSPENPSEGTEVTFTVNIENQGNERANLSRVAYYVDGSSRGYHNIQEMDAGAAVTQTFTWTAQSGPHTIKAVADMQGQVPEINEDNNEKVLTLPPPDLVIETITWSPENTSENSTVTFTVIIGNQGSGRAGSSNVCFYVDGSSTGCENIQEIDAGAAVTQTFTWTAQADPADIKAVADGDNYVIETDESNNEKEITFSVSQQYASGPQPAPVDQISPELQEPSIHINSQDNNITLGQNIVFNFQAINPENNPSMTVELVLQVPSEIGVTSTEFIKDEQGRYTASYSIEPGDSREINVYMRASEEGSFNILGDLTYYLDGDIPAVEHQALSLPVIVGQAEASTAKTLLDNIPDKGIGLDWWFISIVLVVLGGAVTLVLLRSRRRSQQHA